MRYPMKKNLPLLILCFLFGALGIYYGLSLYASWREYRLSAQVYEELTAYIQPAPVVPKPAVPKPTEEIAATVPMEAAAPVDDTLWPTVDFPALQAINPDITGWIYIEGTCINYPVVQGQDNRYYLEHLYNRRSSGVGSIYIDYRNNRDFSHRNTVLYGHNLPDGSMFYPITQYKSQSFYDQHPIALLMTPEKNYRIELVAGFVTDLTDDAWKMEFASDEEFYLWLEESVAKSDFTALTGITPQDRVITFSTCSNEYRDARYVLIGVLK